MNRIFIEWVGCDQYQIYGVQEVNRDFKDRSVSIVFVYIKDGTGYI